MQIKLLLHIVHSKRDSSGNVYWAFIARDPVTGKSISGHISGGESNITAAYMEMGMDGSNVHLTQEERGYRDFKRFISDFAYAGCPPKKIATFIKYGLGWEVPVEEWIIIGKALSDRATEMMPRWNYYLRSGDKYIRGESNTGTFDLGQKLTIEDNNFEERNFNWTRPVKGKPFKIVSISQNANSFGLHGHILLAPDGERWEVCRGRYDGTSWNVGVIIDPGAIPEDGFIKLSCELPKRLEDAPTRAIEAWSAELKKD